MLALPIALLIPLLFLIPLAALPERYSLKLVVVSSFLLLLVVVYALVLANLYGFASLQASFSYLPGLQFSFSLTPFSQVLVLLAAVLVFVSSLLLESYIKESKKLYATLYLIISSSLVGVFSSSSLLPFYMFWEVSEIVMFFMIYSFGGYNRRYAAIKFLIFSLVSSLLLLLGIMLIFVGNTAHSLSIAYLVSSPSALEPGFALAAFILLALSFSIKLPIFPLHTWLPDAYSESPTPSTMLLAGVLSKFGAYGMLLLFLMMPFASSYAKILALAFAFSAFYSSFLAIRQANLKTSIAYVSMLDMAIIALGLSSFSAIGYAGSTYAMLSHGLIIALAFAIVGTVDNSFGTTLISKVRGVAKSMKGLAYSFVFASFAIVGLPLTSSFIADLLIFMSLVHAFGAIGVLPLLAILIVGIFLFWIVARMFFNVGEAIEPYEFPGYYSLFAISLLLGLILLFGILPSLLLSPLSVGL
ncbi:MAG: complex I subunit 4 family protein [Candidatus Micrarchaeia archaeon]